MVRMEKRRTIRLSARGKYTDRYIPSRREKFAAGSLSSACLAHRVFQGAMEPEFPVVAGGTRSDDPSRHEMNGAWPNLSGTAGMGRTGDFRGGMPGGEKALHRLGFGAGSSSADRRPEPGRPRPAGSSRRGGPEPFRGAGSGRRGTFIDVFERWGRFFAVHQPVSVREPPKREGARDLTDEAPLL